MSIRMQRDIDALTRRIEKLESTIEQLILSDHRYQATNPIVKRKPGRPKNVVEVSAQTHD